MLELKLNVQKCTDFKVSSPIPMGQGVRDIFTKNILMENALHFCQFPFLIGLDGVNILNTFLLAIT